MLMLTKHFAIPSQYISYTFVYIYTVTKIITDRLIIIELRMTTQLFATYLTVKVHVYT